MVIRVVAALADEAENNWILREMSMQHSKNDYCSDRSNPMTVEKKYRKNNFAAENITFNPIRYIVKPKLEPITKIKIVKRGVW